MLKIEQYKEEIKQDLIRMAQYSKPVWKDILIVVHNQLDYLKQCIESIKENTENYSIYIWNNNSDPELTEYLKATSGITSVRYSKENLGFIVPNNELIRWSHSDYVILLNSDTKVYRNWDDAMIACLEADPNLAQVGYMGGLLDEEGQGIKPALGSEIDFIPAWCTCIRRADYEKFGLFNENDLEFAYCEDSDFSLRLKEAGRGLYALHLDYVEHYGSQTIKAVQEAKSADVERTFAKNHAYIQNRWGEYLRNERILAKPEYA